MCTRIIFSGTLFIFAIVFQSYAMNDVLFDQDCFKIPTLKMAQQARALRKKADENVRIPEHEISSQSPKKTKPLLQRKRGISLDQENHQNTTHVTSNLAKRETVQKTGSDAVPKLQKVYGGLSKGGCEKPRSKPTPTRAEPLPTLLAPSLETKGPDTHHQAFSFHSQEDFLKYIFEGNEEGYRNYIATHPPK